MRVMNVAIALALTAATASAQAPASAGVHIAILRSQADQVRDLIVKTAQKVPENLYGFKPTPEVRTLGAILGHVADGNVLLCNAASTGQVVPKSVHEKLTTRVDLLNALRASFETCDKAFASTTDANATTPVDLFGRKETRLGILAFSNSHMWEHYGNLVTYMRLNKIVPPSSEQ